MATGQRNHPIVFEVSERSIGIDIGEVHGDFVVDRIGLYPGDPGDAWSETCVSGAEYKAHRAMKILDQLCWNHSRAAPEFSSNSTTPMMTQPRMQVHLWIDHVVGESDHVKLEAKRSLRVDLPSGGGHDA